MVSKRWVILGRADIKRCATCGAVTIALAACGGQSTSGSATAPSAETSSSSQPHTGPASAVSTIRLPHRLLGLSRSTAAASRHITGEMIRRLTASGSPFVRPQAAVYGSFSGPAIVMFAADWSSASKPAPGQSLVPFAKGFAKTLGSTGARSFPAGPKGGVLECGYSAIKGETTIGCGWADDIAGSAVGYLNGAASSLNDAASKTIQVRSAIER